MSVINTMDTRIYLDELDKLLSKPVKQRDFFQSIVDAPFHNRVMTGRLGLGITVLLLVNKKGKTIDRVALARTDLAEGTVAMSVKPFKEIKIPLGDRNNYISIAIRRQHHMVTSDWQYLFVPALTPQEARLNQSGGGIACSAIYPLQAGQGAMIFSYYEPIDRIDESHHFFMREYARLVSERLKSQQK
jgi:hypothetical protein